MVPKASSVMESIREVLPDTAESPVLGPAQHRGTLDHEEGPLKEGIDTTIGTAAHIGGKAQEYGSIAADKTKEVHCRLLRSRNVPHMQESTGRSMNACAGGAVWCTYQNCTTQYSNSGSR